MHRRNLIIVVLLLALLLTAYFGFIAFQGGPKDERGAKLVPLRLTVTPFIDNTMPIIGAERKFYEKYGLSVEFVDTTWPRQFELIASESVDIIMASLDEVVTKDQGLRQVDQQVQYFLPAWQFLGLSFFANTKAGIVPLEQLKDEYPAEEATRIFLDQLAGRKVTFPEGSLFEQAFMSFVNRGKRSISDFDIVNAESEAGLNALEDGDVAMAAVGSQQFAEARRRGYETAISPRDLGLIVITGFVARADIQKGQDVLARFACAWYEIVKWVNENPEAAYGLVNDYMVARGSTSLSFEEFMDLRELNVMPQNPAEARALFLQSDSPASWKIPWNKTKENMMKTGKAAAIPEDTDSFTAPLVLGLAHEMCGGEVSERGDAH